MFQEFPDDNKNDDFLNEFRQKIADQSAANFEEKRIEMKRSKSVFIGAVSGVALAGIVGWFVLSPRYAVNNPEEIPVIRRPQTAIKVQPSDPGGMEILNQDKSVYDIVEKKPEDDTKIENLLPPPEVPQLPVVTAEVETPAQTEIGNPKVAQKAEEIIKAAEQKKAPQPAETVKVSVAAPAVEVKTEPAEIKEVTIKEAAAAPAPAAAAPAPTVEKVAIPAKVTVPAPKENNTPAVAGNWQVQLLSSTNRASVDAAWNNLQKKYPVLKNQPQEIETADLGAKGTYYRLKAGAFSDRAGADKLCADIKALGGTCIVKKK